MCNPIAYALISAAGTAMQVSSANRSAQANQQAAVDQQTMQNNLRIQEQQDQNRQAGLEMTNLAREAARVSATQRVAQGESGVSGMTNYRNMSAILMEASFKKGSIIDLNATQIGQIARQSEMDARQTKNVINIEESKKTSPLGAIVQMGTSAADTYSRAAGFGAGSATGGAKPIKIPKSDALYTDRITWTGSELGMFSSDAWKR